MKTLNNSTPDCTSNPPLRSPRHWYGRFLRDEDGALIIFGIFMFGLMLAIGGLSFDLMRYEANRTRLQATTDRAALAAASLTQSLDPAAVVADYFAKANMTEFLNNVVVTDDFGFRRVDVNASLNVPLHFGNFSVFASPPGENDTLLVEAQSSAMEAIGNVEISMILDNSGSMGSNNRLTNLKIAAKNFIDTVYGAAEAGTVSTSIVPYAEQVTAGANLLSYYNRGDSAHTKSSCLNFESGDFGSTALSTTSVLEQTMHFDPDSSYWSPGNSLSRTPCVTDSRRQILAWSDDPTALKSHVDDFYANGWTSTEIGLKWGAALLDPSAQPALSGMISSGDVSADMSGRPESFTDGETMKVMVVMTDGENTNQRYMADPYRLGDSAVYYFQETNGDEFYSVWGGSGEPDFDPEPECTRWNSKKGTCKTWETPQNWYRVNAGEFNETPYGGSSSTRLTWAKLWQKIPVRHFTNKILYDMGVSSTERNAIKNAIKTIYGSTKDPRMASICSEAKSAGVTIFAVALETNDSAADRLESCASSPAHFYRVTGNEIDFAFQSIASQINMLRLVY